MMNMTPGLEGAPGCNGKPEMNGRATLPLEPVLDGRNGRAPDGRFARGNTCARGNPFARKMAKLRSALVKAIDESKIETLAERLYQQLDSLQPLHLEARRDLLRESSKHAAVKLLRQIPSIGPIRAALLVALLQTPHRFRTKRQLWAYSGFAVETHDSG